MDINHCTFEEALNRLEHIARELETEQLDLETALQRYEEGIRLVQLCMERLRHARLQIEEISSSLDLPEEQS